MPTAPGPMAVAAQQPEPELPLASSLNGPDPPGAALARLDTARIGVGAGLAVCRVGFNARVTKSAFPKPTAHEGRRPAPCQ